MHLFLNDIKEHYLVSLMILSCNIIIQVIIEIIIYKCTGATVGQKHSKLLTTHNKFMKNLSPIFQHIPAHVCDIHIFQQ